MGDGGLGGGVVAGEQVQQAGAPLLGWDRGEFGGVGLGGGGRVGEPPDVAAGVFDVAEEAAFAEDEVVHPGLAGNVEVAGVAAGVEEPDVAGCRGGGVEQRPGAGTDPVGPDEQVGFGGAAVREAGAHRIAGGVGVDEPLVELDADAAPDRLLP